MNEEIVITFYCTENKKDAVWDLTKKGEEIFGYDGNEYGPDSLHIFVSYESLPKILEWFKKQGLKVHRIETMKDYRLMTHEEKEGDFVTKEKYDEMKRDMKKKKEVKKT